jgi:hypothetical protein
MFKYFIVIYCIVSYLESSTIKFDTPYKALEHIIKSYKNGSNKDYNEVEFNRKSQFLNQKINIEKYKIIQKTSSKIKIGDKNFDQVSLEVILFIVNEGTFYYYFSFIKTDVGWKLYEHYLYGTP